MVQKPKHTEADENRRRNITVVVIIVMLGLFFAGFAYYNNLQNRAMDAAAPMILTVDTNETVAPTGLATFTPLPTYTSTLSPTARLTLTPSPPAPNDNTATSTPSPLAPNENRATVTPSPLAPNELGNDVTPVCFFNWAYGDVPGNIVNAIRASLDNGGYDDVDFETSAYGEDRVCQKGDEIVSSTFGLMDITPTILFNVDSAMLNQPSTLGAIIRDLILTINETPDLPKISKIEIEFLSADASRLWVASYRDITTALKDEISDDALYELGITED